MNFLLSRKQDLFELVQDAFPLRQFADRLTLTASNPLGLSAGDNYLYLPIATWGRENLATMRPGYSQAGILVEIETITGGGALTIYWQLCSPSGTWYTPTALGAPTAIGLYFYTFTPWPGLRFRLNLSGTTPTCDIYAALYLTP